MKYYTVIIYTLYFLQNITLIEKTNLFLIQIFITYISYKTNSEEMDFVGKSTGKYGGSIRESGGTLADLEAASEEL